MNETSATRALSLAVRIRGSIPLVLVCRQALVQSKGLVRLCEGNLQLFNGKLCLVYDGQEVLAPWPMDTVREFAQKEARERCGVAIYNYPNPLVINGLQVDDSLARRILLALGSESPIVEDDT